MKILNVIMSIDQKEGGGAVERICNLSKYLSLSGHDCTILTTSKNFSKARVKSLGRVNIVKLSYVSERFIIPIGIFSWLKKNVHKYDKIHLSLNWSAITALTFLYLNFYKIEYYFSAMGWLKISGRSKILKNIYKFLFTIRMLKNAKKCIAISQREIKDYIQYGIKKKNIVLIPNGIDTKYYKNNVSGKYFKKKHKLTSKKIILFIGRIDKIKGVDLLLNAFIKIYKNFENHQLVICGFDGGILPGLRKLCVEKKVETKVTFIGPIWGIEKISAYKSADVFVIPSRFDTMTIVALEAAILSTPVIITKESDFKELENSKGAIIVNARINSIALALKNVLTNRKKLFKMKKNIKNFVKENYSWKLISIKFIKIFSEVN